jgi:hypothetical protein
MARTDAEGSCSKRMARREVDAFRAPGSGWPRIIQQVTSKLLAVRVVSVGT